MSTMLSSWHMSTMQPTGSPAFCSTSKYGPHTSQKSAYNITSFSFPLTWPDRAGLRSEHCWRPRLAAGHPCWSSYSCLEHLAHLYLNHPGTKLTEIHKIISLFVCCSIISKVFHGLETSSYWLREGCNLGKTELTFRGNHCCHSLATLLIIWVTLATPPY